MVSPPPPLVPLSCTGEPLLCKKLLICNMNKVDAKPSLETNSCLPKQRRKLQKQNLEEMMPTEGRTIWWPLMLTPRQLILILVMLLCSPIEVCVGSVWDKPSMP